MSPLWIPLLLQAALMAVDEIYFHRRRGLSTWEIWSHPIDTLAAFICVLFLLNATATVPHLFYTSHVSSPCQTRVKLNRVFFPR